MLKDYLAYLVSGQDLTRADAQTAMNLIMSGQAGEAQIGSFLTALRMKGVTSGEITGFATAMRQQALQIQCSDRCLVDTCGTGGDGKKTFNISTTVAFILAASGLSIAKHGNRGISSSCGSADVLTALGININLPPAAIEQTINEIGIGFMYAPLFHQAMKYAATPRKELGFRTVFNILGPLSNPAKANRQLIGVYERELTVKVAEALAGLGVERAMVVHSFDGMDEISTNAPTQVAELENGELNEYTLDPSELGFSRCDFADYLGGDPQENAVIILKVLSGEPGPKRDIVLLNAAAALKIGGKAADLREGLAIAADCIDSGAALTKVKELAKMTQSMARDNVVC